MLTLKYLLFFTGFAAFCTAAAIVFYDLWLEIQHRRALARGVESPAPEPPRWRTSLALAALAWIPLIIGLSIAVVSPMS